MLSRINWKTLAVVVAGVASYVASAQFSVPLPSWVPTVALVVAGLLKSLVKEPEAPPAPVLSIVKKDGEQ